MLDLVRLYLKAGDGGDGKVAFFRNKKVLKGGPEGGNGGDGGDVIIEVDEKLNTLQHYSGVKQIAAQNGQMGGKARQIGKKGESQVIKVPKGTVVWLFNENQVSGMRRQKLGLSKLFRRDDLAREQYFVEKETNSPPTRERDEIAEGERPRFDDYLHERIEGEDGEFKQLEEGKLLKIATLTQNGSRISLCQGGFGGRGNDSFKSSVNTTPLEAEYGTFGEQKMIFLELRLLANVGFVGLPNAGKSTLLSRLTKAQPKIANYPFTTLEPNLGVMYLDENRSLVIADIPGLVEGASEGKGLGFTFLRHVQNCKELVYVLSLSEEEVFAENINVAEKAEKLLSQYLQVLKEVQDYNFELSQKNATIIVNKSDLYDEDLKNSVQELFQEKGYKIEMISAATGVGLAELKETMWKQYEQS